MLSVSGLTKVFDQQPVFSEFDLTVTQNRFAVLIGPSGCGKSTFFDVLTGVTPADAGQLRWQGEDVCHFGELAAYMHQKDLLLPWFSLLENSLLPARTGGGDLHHARSRALQLFSRLGLSGYEQHLPHQVSGGMRQRCALVRTLMFNRDLILLDEPLSALDAITRKSLQSLLVLLQSEFERTLVMITHDVDEALLLADDLYLLSVKPMAIREKIVLRGDKPRRFDNPELLAMKDTILQRLQGDIEHVAG
jgi:ABC-type nitrate/sulfonate/bicarbonate transport system ATPase subunit